MARAAVLEAQLSHDIRLALGQEPDFVLFRNHVGLSSHGTGDRKRVVRSGLGTGSTDLVGVLAPNGRWVCLEIKTPHRQPTAAQARWMEMVRSFGAFAAVVRSVRGAREALDRARAGMEK